MDFDLDLAKKSTAENPVFYVQYAHTRLAGILKKGKEEGFHPEEDKINLLKDEEELALVKKIARWTEVLHEVAHNYEVHNIAHYLVSLADSLHAFYEKVRVIDKSNPDLTRARLALAEATKKVMADGLGVLGVGAPEQM